MPPYIAAPHPPIVIMITPGIVNNLSLAIIPLIVKEMMERLFVLSAFFIQYNPVMIFPGKIILVKTRISFRMCKYSFVVLIRFAVKDMIKKIRYNKRRQKKATLVGAALKIFLES